MKVQVTIAMFQGLIDDVNVYKTEQQALRKEKKWLKDLEVTDDSKREALSFNGTEFRIFECNLKN